MQWGTFSVAHIISLVAAVLMIVGLYFAICKASRKIQTLVLGLLSFSGIAAIVYNLVSWGSPLEYLPLHLCSINALVLPFAVFSRNKTLCNLLLVWSLGALIALVVNSAMTEAILFEAPFNFYYFPHVMEFGIPILLFKLGHVRKDPKCIRSTLGITLVFYTFAHFVNILLRTCAGVNTNYMFSVDPNENPLTALFYQIIPYEYWYMYLAVPILAVYLCAIYAPQLRQLLKNRKTRRANVNSLVKS